MQRKIHYYSLKTKKVWRYSPKYSLTQLCIVCGETKLELHDNNNNHNITFYVLHIDCHILMTVISSKNWTIIIENRTKLNNNKFNMLRI